MLFLQGSIYPYSRDKCIGVATLISRFPSNVKLATHVLVFMNLQKYDSSGDPCIQQHPRLVLTKFHYILSTMGSFQCQYLHLGHNNIVRMLMQVSLCVFLLKSSKNLSTIEKYCGTQICKSVQTFGPRVDLPKNGSKPSRNTRTKDL